MKLKKLNYTNDKLSSPQMVVTIYKYTTENNLTKKREKQRRKTHTNKWHVLM